MGVLQWPITCKSVEEKVWPCLLLVWCLIQALIQLNMECPRDSSTDRCNLFTHKRQQVIACDPHVLLHSEFWNKPQPTVYSAVIRTISSQPCSSTTIPVMAASLRPCNGEAQGLASAPRKVPDWRRWSNWRVWNHFQSKWWVGQCSCSKCFTCVYIYIHIFRVSGFAIYICYRIDTCQGVVIFACMEKQNHLRWASASYSLAQPWWSLENLVIRSCYCCCSHGKSADPPRAGMEIEDGQGT